MPDDSEEVTQEPSNYDDLIGENSFLKETMMDASSSSVPSNALKHLIQRQAFDPKTNEKVIKFILATGDGDSFEELMA